jgi:hypothetical protein
MTGKLALAALLTIALGALTAGVAGATNTVQIDSTIKLRKSFPAFLGSVRSSNQACAQDRGVMMFL